MQLVKVADVQIGDGTAIRESLPDNFASREVADRLFAWIYPKLKPTLLRDNAQTEHAMEAAAAAVQPVMVTYPAGRILVKAGQPFPSKSICCGWRTSNPGQASNV